MAYSSPTCPICDTDIQDPSQEECGKCGWILITESSLDPKTYNLLIDWAIRRYARVQELESRGKYNQDRLNHRLNSQRNDIDFLRQQIEKIWTHLKSEPIAHFQDIQPLNITNAVTINDDCLPEITEEEYSITAKSFNFANTTNMIEPDNKSRSIAKSSRVNNEFTEIISDYLYKPIEFAAHYKIITVNITKDSIDSNRRKEEKVVILEENNRGNYWIFEVDSFIYLVPVPDKYINQHSYSSTSMMFEGSNYTPDYQKIQLVKPAILSIDPNTNPQTWRLQQQGELVFL
jgi:hypothetical protein